MFPDSADSRKLWRQLSLSASLKILQPDDWKLSQPDLSILLSQGPSTIPSTSLPHGWLLDNIDVRPPPCVFCAQLERLQIILDFRTLQERPLQLLKRPKMARQESESMLLGRFPVRSETYIGPFEIFDSHTQRHPSFVTDISEEHEPNLFHQVAFPLYDKPQRRELIASPVLPTQNCNSTKNLKGKGRFPKEITNKLKASLEAHLKNPYPKEHEKLELMKQSGLQRSILTHPTHDIEPVLIICYIRST